MNRFEGVINFSGETLDDVQTALKEATSLILDSFSLGNNCNDSRSYDFKISDKSEMACISSLNAVSEKILINVKNMINSKQDIVERVFVSRCEDSDFSDEYVLRFELKDPYSFLDLENIFDKLNIVYEPVMFLDDARQLLIKAEFF